MSESYQELNLDDLGFLGRGKSKHRPRNDPVLYGGDFPFIQTGNVKAANLHIREYSETYNETGLSQSKLWDKGTLLITIAANIAETAILDIKACFPDSIVGFVPDESKVNSYFVKYYIDYIKREMQSISQGTTQDNLSLEKIRTFKLKIPAKEIVDEITNVLLTYDNLIENNNRRIAILEVMAQSLYREWFVKFRFPDHENTKFIDSPLGKIPERWQVVALEDICERITDGAHKSPKSVDVGVPMASVKDMHDFGLNLSTCRQISEEDYLELERQDSVVKGNDVLIAKDGSYLKHTFVVEKDEKVALLSSIAMLRPNERVKSHWLAYCLRSENVKERMKQCVSGVAVPRIILKDFKQFKILLPPQEVQNAWNQVVEQNVKLCWTLIRKNQNLKSQRNMLLPKLISGLIDISDKENK